MVITIDGPVASGKSSVARALASSLDIFYLNTGYLYRGVAYVFHEELAMPIEPHQELSAQELSCINRLRYSYRQGSAYIDYNGRDITPFLQDALLDSVASTVSANKSVRAALLHVQRDIGKRHDLVCDGRDCGSVVFADADYKFYLDADVAIRAQRVFNDSYRKSRYATIEEAREAIALRDKQDMSRDIAPLKVPKDAIIIDNSHMTLEQTVDAMLAHINKR